MKKINKINCRLFSRFIVAKASSSFERAYGLTTSTGLSDSREYPTFTGWALFKVESRPQQEIETKQGVGELLCMDPLLRDYDINGWSSIS